MTAASMEAGFLWAALIGYVAVSIWSAIAFTFRHAFGGRLLALIAGSVGLHTIALGLRWAAIGHLPVISAYEMLSANLWGLMLAVAIGYWRLPKVRVFVTLLMPIIIMLMAWMLLKPSDASAKPATYDTIWLFIHIGFIKLFLGCAFIALGLAIIILTRGARIWNHRFDQLPDDQGLDLRAARFMALALIFDSLGIVAGAIWAQDAWHRYWSWDPLEVWSLITWLSIGLTLHVRSSYGTPPRRTAWLIVATFTIAFFTFFGIPFVSVALHKGAI